MKERELLRNLGIETIYSAKGHFKACDIRRKWITSTIWICSILTVVSLFDVDPVADKVLSGINLLGLLALLIWNEGEGKDYRARHKQVGESYLSLHKEIRESYFLEDYSKEHIIALGERVRKLDRSEKPDIPGVARRAAKKAIEKKGETDNWFLPSN